MAYTVQDVISDMRVSFPSSDVISDSMIVRRVNWVVQDIAYRLELPDFHADHDVTLVASQSTYTLPSQLLKIRSVKLVDEPVALTPITAIEEASMFEDDEGTPAMYLREGNSIILYPAPSSAYDGDTLRIRYLRWPDELSQSDSIPLPIWLHEAVNHGVRARLYHDNGEPERAAAETAIYLGVLGSRRDSDTRQAEDIDVGIYPSK